MELKLYSGQVQITEKAIELAVHLAKNTLSCFGRHDFQNSVKYYFDGQERIDRLNRVLSNLGSGFDSQAVAQLEVGSGTGLYTLLCNMLGVRTLGVEPSDNKYSYSLEISRELLRSNGFPDDLVIEGVGEQLPFADEQFDIVVSFQVLEHVRNPYKVLAEMKRVVKRGGIIYLEFPNYRYPVEPHYLKWFIPFISSQLNARLFALSGLPEDEIKHIRFLNDMLIRNYANDLQLEICTESEEICFYHLDEKQDFNYIDRKYGQAAHPLSFVSKLLAKGALAWGINPQVKVCLKKK